MKAEKAGEKQLHKALLPVVQVIRLQHYWNWLIKGLVLGLALASIVLVMARLVPMADSIVLAGVIGFLSLPVALGWAWWKRPGPWEAALRVDGLGLQERVTTAWQLRASEEPLVLQQRQDALAVLERFDRKRLSHFSLPKREIAYLALLFFAASGLAFWPNSLDQVAKERKQLKKELAVAKKEIEKVEKLVKEDKKLEEKVRRELEAELKKIQQQLAKAKSLEEGTAVLAKGQQELLKKLLKEQQKAELTTVAQSLSQNSLTKAAGEALQKGDIEKFRREMAKLQENLKDLSPEEKEKLTNLMKELAKALKAQNPELAKAFSKAAANLNSASGKGQGGLGAITESLAKQASTVKDSENLAENLQLALNQAKGNLLEGGQQTGNNAGGNSGNPGNANGAAGSNGSGSNSGNNGSSGGSSGSSGSSSGGASNGGSSGQGNGGGAGTGSTNQKGGSFNSGGPASGNQNSAAPNKEGTHERIYVPSRLGDGGQNSEVKGAAGDGGDATKVDLDNSPMTGGSLLPYSQVLPQYQSEATENMEKQYVPENLKELVKSYFVNLAE